MNFNTNKILEKWDNESPTSEQTMKVRLCQLEIIKKDFLNDENEKITTKKIKDYYDSLLSRGFHESTARSRLYVLRRIFKYLGYNLDNNPAQSVLSDMYTVEKNMEYPFQDGKTSNTKTRTVKKMKGKEKLYQNKTIDELVIPYMEYHILKYPNNKDESLRVLKSKIRLLANLFPGKISEITPEEITKAKNKLAETGIKPITITGYICVLRKLLKFSGNSEKQKEKMECIPFPQELDKEIKELETKEPIVELPIPEPKYTATYMLSGNPFPETIKGDDFCELWMNMGIRLADQVKVTKVISIWINGRLGDKHDKS